MSLETELSEREIEILRLVATGASNKEIASTLVISPNTVKVHLRNIFAKIGAVSRTEATLIAMRMGLVETISEAHTLENHTSEGGASGLLTALPEAAAQTTTAAVPFWRRAWLGAAVLVLLIAGFALGIMLNNSPAAPNPTPASATPTLNPSRWQSTLGLPQARSGMAGVTFEGALYLFGGSTLPGSTASSLRFTPLANRWEELAPKPTAVSEAQAAVLGEMIYIPGGRLENNQPSAILEAYSPRQNRWETLAPLPRALSGYALAALDGTLYLFGGWDGEQYSEAVLAYSPDSNQWQARGSLKQARAYASAVASEGRIYLIGGYNGKSALSSVQVYYPSREKANIAAWEERAPLPEGRYAMGSATIVNLIYIIGGESDSPAEGGLAPLQYLASSNQWVRFERAPQATGSKLALLALDTRLHIIGGQTSGGISAAHQTYQAIYTISLPSIQN